MNSTNTVKKPPKGRHTSLLDQELKEKMDAERRQRVSNGERVTMSSLTNERLNDWYALKEFFGPELFEKLSGEMRIRLQRGEPCTVFSVVIERLKDSFNIL